MSILRSKELHKKYMEYIAQGGLSKGCVLCVREPLVEFKLWKIIPNDFPYDRIARVHHMVVPKRHVIEIGLSSDELHELQQLKMSYINQTYEFIIEPTAKLKTIPEHFHLHLVVPLE